MRYQIEQGSNGNVGTMSRGEDRIEPIDLCDVVDMCRPVSKRVVCTARYADATLIAGALNAVGGGARLQTEARTEARAA
jgi:hypothetical protein